MNLTIDNITKKYGKTIALQEVSVTLEKGIYGLLGPNGAGKSTLMNILVNDMVPDSGQVLFNGSDIHKMGVYYRKQIGYMPQQQNMYEYFTGYRFLSYMAALKGMDAKYAKERIWMVAGKVNLDTVLGNKIGSYSGGMKQRLLIAQAILDEPAVLILDEPTAGLDPKERIRIRNLVSEIAKDKIVLIATHVVQDIEYIAKEILMLKKGTLVCKAAPHELIASLDGKVYEIQCMEDEVSSILQKHLVTNLVREENAVRIRILCETKPEGSLCEKVTATMEDCYLYEFQDETVFS